MVSVFPALSAALTVNDLVPMLPVSIAEPFPRVPEHDAIPESSSAHA